MGALLEVKDLGVDFNGFKAVDSVDMRIDDGEIRVIIGPNGAGKTTFMDLVTGKTRPTKGTIMFNGHNITGKEPDEIAGKYKIGRKFQGPNIFENMTVYQNIEIALKGYTSIWHTLTYKPNARKRERIKAILKKIKLYDMKDFISSELSHGQRQWLEIGMVMAQSPKLIILDEPTAGMTADETHETGEMLKDLAGDHTIIVTEHDMAFVRQVANRVTVLHQGRLLTEGLLEEVEKNPEVIQVYLKED